MTTKLEVNIVRIALVLKDDRRLREEEETRIPKTTAQRNSHVTLNSRNDRSFFLLNDTNPPHSIPIFQQT